MVETKREESSPSDRSRRQKRPRVQFSCSECHRRKQKCDRGAPCSSCVARKAPHLCVEYKPGYDALDTDSRIARLESAVDVGIEQILKRIDALAGSRPRGSEQTHSLASSSNSGNLNAAGPSQIQPRRLNSRHNPAQQKSKTDFDPLQMVTLSYDAARTTYDSLRAHLYPGPADDDEAEEDEAAKARRSTAESSRLAMSARTLVDDLPSPSTRSHALLEHYFVAVNPLHMPLPRKLLEPAFKALIDDPARQQTHLHQFALLAALLSFSLVTAPIGLLRDPDEPESRFDEANRLVDAAQLALMTAGTFQADDLDKVLAWVLLSRVHSIEERTHHAWEAATSALRSSYAMGLQREHVSGASRAYRGGGRRDRLLASTSAGSREDDSEEDVDEMRRVVWALCFFQERSLSLSLNRPSMATDAMHTTRPPRAYTLETRDKLENEEIRVLSNAYYHALATLMGRINDVVQRTDGHALFDEAQAIDGEIDQFRRSLDPFLGPFSTDVNEPINAPTLASEMLYCHQWTIHAELDALRIALHRPFLSPTSIGCRQARAASIQASWDSLARRSRLVFTFQRRYGSGTTPRSFLVIINQSQRFSMVLACCISLLINPRDGDALRLREIIGRYLELMPRRMSRYGREGDYRRKRSLERETKILHLFLEQADRLSALMPEDSIPSLSGLDTSQQQLQQSAAPIPPLPMSAASHETPMTMDQTVDAIRAFFSGSPKTHDQHDNSSFATEFSATPLSASASASAMDALGPNQLVGQQQQQQQQDNLFALLMKGQTDEAQFQSSLVEALCAGMNWTSPGKVPYTSSL